MSGVGHGGTEDTERRVPDVDDRGYAGGGGAAEAAWVGAWAEGGCGVRVREAVSVEAWPESVQAVSEAGAGGSAADGECEAANA